MLEKEAFIEKIMSMTEPEKVVGAETSLEDIKKGWHDLTLRVSQLEVEKDALQHENKSLRFLVERVIEHRQKSHSELVLLLSGLVSKLPINDIGVVVSRLVEHNAHVGEVLTALVKGKTDFSMPQPSVLKALDQTKRDLLAAVKPTVEELLELDPPIASEMLRSLITQPEGFFSPRMIRATRCFVKGQVPRDRIVKEFGDAALIFFNDMTTDRKLNPNPNPDEIVLNFKSDFETLFQQNPGVIPDKRQELQALYQRVQRSKTDRARAQRNAFQRLSFILELLHYYENQNTEAPDVVFAQRLPVLVEQLVVGGTQDNLDEKLIAQAETLLAFVISPDYRQAIVNNIGKSGGIGKTLKYVLTFRAQKLPLPDEIMHEVIPEFVKHLIQPKMAPQPPALTPVLRLLNPDMQRLIVRAIMDTDRLRKDDATALGKAVGTELGLPGLDEVLKAERTVSPEMERQMAWEKIKDLVTSRSDPTAIAAAVRSRLHAKYDADEIKQSWLVLTEADPISLIRVFCQLPYLSDGSTDPVARAIMETYVTRLTHEKYAVVYNKVLKSLKNMFVANPNSPTLLNFLALVKWVDSEAANKVTADVGMQVPTH
jgi:hypothetical protein